MCLVRFWCFLLLILWDLGKLFNVYIFEFVNEDGIIVFIFKKYYEDKYIDKSKGLKGC